MTVSNVPHMTLGIKMLKPWEDGSEKDESEMTRKHLTNLMRKMEQTP